MNDHELYLLQHKLDKVTKIKTSIKNIENILENIENGECRNIEFSYMGEYKGLFGQIDDGELGQYTQAVTPKTIGISEKTFSDLFSSSIKQHLLEIKNQMEQEYAEIE